MGGYIPTKAVSTGASGKYRTYLRGNTSGVGSIGGITTSEGSKGGAVGSSRPGMNQATGVAENDDNQNQQQNNQPPPRPSQRALDLFRGEQSTGMSFDPPVKVPNQGFSSRYYGSPFVSGIQYESQGFSSFDIGGYNPRNQFAPKTPNVVYGGTGTIIPVLDNIPISSGEGPLDVIGRVERTNIVREMFTGGLEVSNKPNAMDVNDYLDQVRSIKTDYLGNLLSAKSAIPGFVLYSTIRSSAKLYNLEKQREDVTNLKITELNNITRIINSKLPVYNLAVTNSQNAIFEYSRGVSDFSSKYGSNLDYYTDSQGIIKFPSGALTKFQAEKSGLMPTYNIPESQQESFISDQNVLNQKFLIAQKSYDNYNKFKYVEDLSSKGQGLVIDIRSTFNKNLAGLAAQYGIDSSEVKRYETRALISKGAGAAFTMVEIAPLLLSGAGAATYLTTGIKGGAAVLDVGVTTLIVGGTALNVISKRSEYSQVYKNLLPGSTGQQEAYLSSRGKTYGTIMAIGESGVGLGTASILFGATGFKTESVNIPTNTGSMRLTVSTFKEPISGKSFNLMSSGRGFGTRIGIPNSAEIYASGYNPPVNLDNIPKGMNLQANSKIQFDIINSLVTNPADKAQLANLYSKARIVDAKTVGQGNIKISNWKGFGDVSSEGVSALKVYGQELGGSTAGWSGFIKSTNPFPKLFGRGATGIQGSSPWSDYTGIKYGDLDVGVMGTQASANKFSLRQARRLNELFARFGAPETAVASANSMSVKTPAGKDLPLVEFLSSANAPPQGQDPFGFKPRASIIKFEGVRAMGESPSTFMQMNMATQTEPVKIGEGTGIGSRSERLKDVAKSFNMGVSFNERNSKTDLTSNLKASEQFYKARYDITLGGSGRYGQSTVDFLKGIGIGSQSVPSISSSASKVSIVSSSSSIPSSFGISSSTRSSRSSVGSSFGSSFGSSRSSVGSSRSTYSSLRLSGIPGFPIFPSLGGGGGYSRSYFGFGGGSRVTKYTPSFSALFFGLRGSYKPGKLKTSGLDYRPITKGYSLFGSGFKVKAI